MLWARQPRESSKNYVNGYTLNSLKLLAESQGYTIVDNSLLESQELLITF